MSNKTKRALELVDEIIIDCYDSIASGIELTSCRDLLGKLGNLKAILSEQEGREANDEGMECEKGDDSHCPTCNEYLINRIRCFHCGQKIIWPNTDEQVNKLF